MKGMFFIIPNLDKPETREEHRGRREDTEIHRVLSKAWIFSVNLCVFTSVFSVSLFSG